MARKAKNPGSRGPYNTGHLFRRLDGKWQRQEKNASEWLSLRVEFGNPKRQPPRGDAVKGEYVAVQPSLNTWHWE